MSEILAGKRRLWNVRARGAVVLAGWAGLVVALSGCQLVRSPWVEDPAMTAPVQTASTEAIRAAGVAPAVRTRFDEPQPTKEVYAAAAEVEHLPLWFEDPFEEMDTPNDGVAYVSEDFYRPWCSGARFALNLAFLPVTAVVHPPWQVMTSDGVPSRWVACAKHDADVPCCHH